MHLKNRLLRVGDRMLNPHWLLSSAIVASALYRFCAAAQGANCTGAMGEVEVRGNLDIAARCQLTRTNVRGNVTLFSGGSLIARDVSIRGHLKARRADFVAIEGGDIDGNVTLEELVGDNSSIESTEIRGNVTLTSNRSAFEILNNEIDGNVRASGNTGGVSISGNSIGGNLECSDNTPAPVGLGNVVEKRAQGQCQNLRPQESNPPPSPSPPAPPPETPAPPPTPSSPPPSPPPTSDRPPTTSPTTSVTPATSPPASATPSPATPATPTFAGSPPAAPNPPPATTPPVSDNSGPRDTTPPTLTLRGAPSVRLTIDSPYADAGATATDSTDGDLTSRIVVVNPVNTALLGTFTITYSVSDLSGNVATPVTRTVTVEPQPAGGGGGGGAVGWPFALLLPPLVGRYLIRRAKRNPAEAGQPLRLTTRLRIQQFQGRLRISAWPGFGRRGA